MSLPASLLKWLLSPLALTAVAGSLALPSLRADELVIQAVESGAGVAFSFSGSIDTDDFGSATGGSLAANLNPMGGVFLCGAPEPGPYPAIDNYGGVIPGADVDKAFGTGGNTVPTSTSGDAFGFSGSSLFLPENYVSGSPITGSMFFADETFASLGVDRIPTSFNSTFGMNTIFINFPETTVVVDPADPRRKIRKLQKKAKKLKKKGKKAKAKKLLKKVKKLKRQLAALG